MSCRKKCGKCNECESFKSEQGPRGFRGSPGPTGPIGPTGPCCTGPTGPGSGVVPTFFPSFKPLAATFYGVGSGTVGPGDIFSFPLDGPNDPIGRADSGTFVLPFAGLYKVSWQMPITEGAVVPFGPTAPGPVAVQSTLTAQTVAEGAFVPVAGGVSGRGAPLAELVGETIVEATRNDFPIRIENTSRGATGPTGLPGPLVGVNYYSPLPDSPNQRTINIASLVPQRTYAAAILINSVPQVVAPNADVTFNQSGLSPNNPIGPSTQANVGLAPPTPPHVGLVIEQAGTYAIEWATYLNDATFQGTFPFFPYVNGAPVLTVGNFGPGGSPDFANRILSAVAFSVGDVVTLRNETGTAVSLRNDVSINALLSLWRVNP